jgi:ribonuclease P/MRP protein subunit RPP20
MAEGLPSNSSTSGLNNPSSSSNTNNSSGSSANNSQKVWLDPEEFAIRKRLPPALPRRPFDIYITNKTAFKAQLDRCQQFIDKGEPEIYLHSLGGAIPRALNLALQIQKVNSHTVTLETVTSTVELTDDFEPFHCESGPAEAHQRFNSAVHVKITYNPQAESETAAAANTARQQEQ